MADSEPYRIPSESLHRTEIVVLNSRFITSIGRAATADEAKTFLKQVGEEMSDASHHVYAFRAGFGNSVTEGMSDAGEPSGTAGPPTLAVLRGTDIGDVIVVVTRYFGGTKLGTGGLARAYSEATRTGLNSLPTELKIEKRIVGIEISYSLFEIIKRMIASNDGVILDESFTGTVAIMAEFPLNRIDGFADELREATNGQVEPIIFDPS
jgi:uncharacterized YigZ family protein